MTDNKSVLEIFILERIKKLTVKSFSLKKELDIIKTEIKQLQRTHVATNRRSIPEKTIKEAVIIVLNEFPEGLKSLEILNKINSLLGVDYPRTSLSPQLSRLKYDNRIERTDVGSWVIPRA